MPNGQERRHVGCELDPICSQVSLRRVISTFARELKDGRFPELKEETDVQLSAAKIAHMRRFQNPENWKAPAGFPECTALPKCLVKMLSLLWGDEALMQNY